jgi:hypothetical protein
VCVFVQLSSNGRTGILSMVISWKFAQGPWLVVFMSLAIMACFTSLLLITLVHAISVYGILLKAPHKSKGGSLSSSSAARPNMLVARGGEGEGREVREVRMAMSRTGTVEK